MEIARNGRVSTYAALWAQTNFSFLEGASHPEDIVYTAYKNGLQSIAICDSNGLYGVVRAYHTAKKLGIHIIIGSTVTMADGSRIVLLVQNQVGYQNLCRLITRAHARGRKSVSCCWDDLLTYNTGLILLTNFTKKGAMRCFESAKTQPDIFARIHKLKEAYGKRMYGLISRHLYPGDNEREVALRAIMTKLSIDITCANHVLYHHPDQKLLHDVMWCIRHRVSLSQAGRRIAPNAEHYVLPPSRFISRFAGCEREIQTTLQIADQCVFSLGQLRYRYPLENIPDNHDANSWLRQCCINGAKVRYGSDIPERAFAQLNHELRLIRTLDYAGYFLTMWDIVNFCQDADILCQGRGSAANSVVCYCLGVTAVDPIYMNLLFERFMSKERHDPPDIDLDIEHNRREEVIQYVYKKYGREHAAMVAVVICYRPKSAVRDIGKVLDIPPHIINHVAKCIHRYRGDLSQIDRAIDSAIEIATSKKQSVALSKRRHWVKLINDIQGFPRHLSIHPGGFLLGSEKIDTLVPIEPATMNNRTIIQWDKDDIERLGLFKVDLLGLGALHLVHRCFDLLQKHKDKALSLATIPKDDPLTYEMICRADTIGVFQIESRAQMSMLPRLKPRTFYDLVVQISIVRPGPISGDMVHPYLRRRQGLEPITYPHPILEPVLSKTLGIPLFQEQVIKLAMIAADYTPGEADQLRRDMAAWKRTGQIDKHKDRLVSRMVSKGIEAHFAERIFAQIKGFGEYGFPESHAASFAIIAYATSWLKCHHPDVFATALVNSLPMGFYAPSTIIEDVKRQGVRVLPIDARYSQWECILEREPQKRGDVVYGEGEHISRNGSISRKCSYHAIRMGLSLVKGLHKQAADRLVECRGRVKNNIPADYIVSANLDKQSSDALWRAGAFEFHNTNRRSGLWSVSKIIDSKHDTLSYANPATNTSINKVEKNGSLDLSQDSSTVLLPPERLLKSKSKTQNHSPLYEEMRARLPSLTAAERVNWDYSFSKHSTRGHPMLHVRAAMSDAKRRLFVDSKRLRQIPDKQCVQTIGLVICRQQPSTAKGVVFMTLEDEFGLINLIISKPVYERNKADAKLATYLIAHGQTQHKEDVRHISVTHLRKHDVSSDQDIPPELTSISRDFH